MAPVSKRLRCDGDLDDPVDCWKVKGLQLTIWQGGCQSGRVTYVLTKEEVRRSKLNPTTLVTAARKYGHRKKRGVTKKK